MHAFGSKDGPAGFSQEDETKTSDEIGRSVASVCKKAGILVGQLADPASFHHLVYEQARFHISHLAGKEALHSDPYWVTEHAYNAALNQLDSEINKALGEGQRRA